jgi:hypothetical protein
MLSGMVVIQSTISVIPGVEKKIQQVQIGQTSSRRLFLVYSLMVWADQKQTDL